MAKRMEEGPVLIFSFVVQQTKCIRDGTGAIIEGGEVRAMATGSGYTTTAKAEEEKEGSVRTTVERERGEKARTISDGLSLESS